MPDREEPVDARREQSEPLPLVERIEEFRLFMRECRSCQEEVEPHWQFCASCGVRRSTECPGCSTPLPPSGAPSCPNCGLEIPQASG